MIDLDTVVIGSGAGGLGAALALARSGQQVLVVEQAPAAGGYCHAFEIEGHRFDTGVHYVGQLQPGGRLRAIYEGLGVSGDLVFCELVPEGLDHVLVAGERFELGRGAEAIATELGARFPADAPGIRKVVDILVRVAEELTRLGGRGLPEEIPEAVRDAPVLLRWGRRTLKELLETYIEDPRARTVLATRCGDHGLPPSRASVALHALVTAHYFDGAWYPMGGSQAIVEAMIAGIRRHGGEVRVSSPVARILVEGRGPARRVLGVRLADGTEIRARHVVSDADPHVTYAELVGPEHLGRSIRRRLAKTRWSTSCLSLFAAADLDPVADHLDSGNIWAFDQPDLEPLFIAGIDPPLDRITRFPGHFLTVTTLKDPSGYRGAAHTLEAFSFVPYEAFEAWQDAPPWERPAAYHRLKDRLLDVMVDTVERTLPGLRERIVFARLGTPLSNRAWVRATRGNLYGVDKTLDQVGRHGFRARSPIHDLWLCGASVGAMGVLGATWSGLSTAAQLLGVPVGDLLTAGGPPLRTVPAEHPERWPADLRPARAPVPVPPRPPDGPAHP